MVLLLKPGTAGQLHSAFSGALVLPTAARTAPRRSSQAAQAVGVGPCYKLDKPERLWEAGETWYPGAEPPAHLDGSLPGDRGFDPLRLSENPELLPWMVEGEFYNGRWAMAGVLGMFFVEATGLGPWGSAPFRFDYGVPYIPLVIASHVVYITIEYFRWVNFQKSGESGILNFSPFDPLGLANDRFLQIEVRNGRLAMLGCLGFWTQAAVTRKGPIDNLKDHLADPGHNNICTSPVGLEFSAFMIALAITPYYLEARKDFAKQGSVTEPFRPFPFFSPDDY